MKCVIIALSFVVAIHAASYELVPAIEYDGELYIPLSQLRIARSADVGAEAASTATATQQGVPGFGFPFGGAFGGPHAVGGGFGNAGAKAGAGGFGGSDSTSNAQTQTFTGNGFTGSAASSSSHSVGGHLGAHNGGAKSEANAESQTATKV